jgi:pimeloyl-ACP methyl ester carboxylesterase
VSQTDYQQWADSLKDGITYLIAQNTAPSSKLYGMISGVFGVIGHSSGADGALLAAAQDTRISAVIAQAATSPLSDSYSIPVYGNASLITAPVQLQIGSADLIVAPSDCEHFYPVLKSPKEFVEITNAGHMSFMDIGTGYPENAYINKYMVNWFDYYLKGDTSNYTYIFGNGAQNDLATGALSVLEFAPQ